MYYAWTLKWTDKRIKLFSSSSLLSTGNREIQGSGSTLLDRRQAVTESNPQDMSSSIPFFSATKGLGTNRNIQAYAFVHSTSVSADGMQEGEILPEGELVHHVKSRRNIMGYRSRMWHEAFLPDFEKTARVLLESLLCM